MLLDILGKLAKLSLIIAARYAVVAAGAYWLFWGGGSRLVRQGRLNRHPPTRSAIRHEVVTSLLASPIYALPVAVVMAMWERGGTAIYADPAARGWLWLPVSAAIYLLAHDAFYYWLHRAMHHPKLFGRCHRGHHLSHDPSPFASFSFDPGEAVLTAWFLPLLALFIPIQIYVALTLLLFMTATAVLNHAGREVWPDRWLDTPVGAALITARHHDLHHKRFNGNYGLYFRFWDRAMSTELTRAEPGRQRVEPTSGDPLSARSSGAKPSGAKPLGAEPLGAKSVATG